MEFAVYLQPQFTVVDVYLDCISQEEEEACEWCPCVPTRSIIIHRAFLFLLFVYCMCALHVGPSSTNLTQLICTRVWSVCMNTEGFVVLLSGM
jgi:hypothetical protein